MIYIIDMTNLRNEILDVLKGKNIDDINAQLIISDILNLLRREEEAQKNKIRQTQERINTFVSQQKDIPPDVAEVISNNFWELL